MNEPTKPTTSDNQRGISITEVLIAIATLATALLSRGDKRSEVTKGPM